MAQKDATSCLIYGMEYNDNEIQWSSALTVKFKNLKNSLTSLCHKKQVAWNADRNCGFYMVTPIPTKPSNEVKDAVKNCSYEPCIRIFQNSSEYID